MRKIFDHPVHSKDAAKKLFSIRQGSRLVAEFAIEFVSQQRAAGMKKRYKGAFQNALNENIKDELVSWSEPDGLDKLAALAIRVDNPLRECRKERTGKITSTVTPSTLPCFSPPTVSQSLPEPEPMQPGHAKLTPEERQSRVKTRSCLYCGQTGYFLITCPMRQVKEAVQQ